MTPPALPTVNITEPADIVKPSDDLAEIATEINACVEKMNGNAKHILLHAIRVGELLTKARYDKEIPHGQWARWLGENCAFSKRTADRYIRIYSNRDEIESEMKANCATVAHLTLRQMEQSISSAKPNAGESNPSKSVSPAPSAPSARVIASNDPETAVQVSEEKYFSALQSLQRGDHEAAKAVASKFLRRLQEAKLL
jgi:hypothetical protein